MGAQKMRVVHHRDWTFGKQQKMRLVHHWMGKQQKMRLVHHWNCTLGKQPWRLCFPSSCFEWFRCMPHSVAHSRCPCWCQAGTDIQVNASLHLHSVTALSCGRHLQFDTEGGPLR